LGWAATEADPLADSRSRVRQGGPRDGTPSSAASFHVTRRRNPITSRLIRSAPRQTRPHQSCSRRRAEKRKKEIPGSGACRGPKDELHKVAHPPQTRLSGAKVFVRLLKQGAAGDWVALRRNYYDLPVSEPMPPTSGWGRGRPGAPAQKTPTGGNVHVLSESPKAAGI